MRRREFVAVLFSATLAASRQGLTQVVVKPLVGVLVAASAAGSARYLGGFMKGMREVGYVDGQNVNVVYRYADGDFSRLEILAEELVRLGPAALVAANTAAALALKKATATTPIVCANLVDPIALGLVASQARPGGQVTGILINVETLPGKQLELALEAVPGAKKVGILMNVANPVSRRLLQDVSMAADLLRVSLVTTEVSKPDELERAFQVLTGARVDLVIPLQDAMFLSERKRLVSLAADARLPTIYGLREIAEEGGLMSYGISLHENYRRSAVYVDKILRGTSPGDLPVELPPKLELVLNLKSAKALGLTIPPELVGRADEVIE